MKVEMTYKSYGVGSPGWCGEIKINGGEELCSGPGHHDAPTVKYGGLYYTVGFTPLWRSLWKKAKTHIRSCPHTGTDTYSLEYDESELVQLLGRCASDIFPDTATSQSLRSEPGYEPVIEIRAR